MVAGLEPVDARTDLLHDAGALVAADHRRAGSGTGEVAGHDVLVGVAHAGGDQLDQHFVLLRGIELDLLDAPRRVDLAQDGGACLHVQTPRESIGVQVYGDSGERPAAAPRRGR
ncbi:MAG: hypothetical protein R2697_14825 [Ilumatobacteraceae bacterium]